MVQGPWTGWGHLSSLYPAHQPAANTASSQKSEQEPISKGIQSDRKNRVNNWMDQFHGQYFFPVYSLLLSCLSLLQTPCLGEELGQAYKHR